MFLPEDDSADRPSSIYNQTHDLDELEQCDGCRRWFPPDQLQGENWCRDCCDWVDEENEDEED